MFKQSSINRTLTRYPSTDRGIKIGEKFHRCEINAISTPPLVEGYKMPLKGLYQREREEQQIPILLMQEYQLHFDIFRCTTKKDVTWVMNVKNISSP